MNKWIETKKEMPENYVIVLVWIPQDEIVGGAFRRDADWFLAGTAAKIKNIITHWMPLPEPPKELKQQEK